eukprot:scaffold68079_cov66-Cyclotella_meneghiniana.AAC.11
MAVEPMTTWSVTAPKSQRDRRNAGKSDMDEVLDGVANTRPKVRFLSIFATRPKGVPNLSDLSKSRAP